MRHNLSLCVTQPEILALPHCCHHSPCNPSYISCLTGQYPLLLYTPSALCYCFVRVCQYRCAVWVNYCVKSRSKRAVFWMWCIASYYRKLEVPFSRSQSLLGDRQPLTSLMTMWPHQEAPWHLGRRCVLTLQFWCVHKPLHGSDRERNNKLEGTFCSTQCSVESIWNASSIWERALCKIHFRGISYWVMDVPQAIRKSCLFLSSCCPRLEEKSLSKYV